MDVVLAAIAVAAFAATLLVVVRAAGDAQRRRARTVADPAGDEWMTVDEVAELLEVRRSGVSALVDRQAIPYYLVAAGDASDPDRYRFRRDEIEAWTIG